MAPTVTPHTLFCSCSRDISISRVSQCTTHTNGLRRWFSVYFFICCFFMPCGKFCASRGLRGARERKGKLSGWPKNFHLTCVGELSSIFQIRSFGTEIFSVSFQRSSINVCLISWSPSELFFSLNFFKKKYLLKKEEEKLKKNFGGLKKLKWKFSWRTLKKEIRQTSKKKLYSVIVSPKKKAASEDLQAAAAEAEIYQFLIIFSLSHALELLVSHSFLPASLKLVFGCCCSHSNSNKDEKMK